MKTAQNHFLKSLTFLPAALVIFGVFSAMPKVAWATVGSPQICRPNETCIVGEFLYDDEYTPIATASCTLTTRDTDDVLVHNAVAMTADSDGWYSYSFTAPSDEEMYRSQLCCTFGTEYLCVDKSFQVESDAATPSTNDISSAVWSYSDRTLSSFGTLVRDVWLNSSRTLTNLFTGTKPTDASSDAVDLSGLENKIDENRLLLEELVNEPIIEMYLGEEEDVDLGKKLDETNAVASRFFVNSQFIVAKTRLIASKWSGLTAYQVGGYATEMSELLGEVNDSHSDKTFFGQVNWLREQWGFEATEDIYSESVKIKDALTLIQRKTGSYSTSTLKLSDIRTLAFAVSSMEKLVGNVSDSSSSHTLFGQIREVSELALALDKSEKDLDQFLADWNKVGSKDKKEKVLIHTKDVLALNRIPQIRSVISASLEIEPDDKELKNRTLASKAVVIANRISLAKKAGRSVAYSWLEMGSIVFKILATNPSKLIEQEVPLKFYLPKEVREEHILEVDDELTVSYDSERDQYYAEGTFTLAKEETRTFKVKVDDIFEVTSDEIDSIRKQAGELAKPLEGTSYFAQGVTLKTDIDASLDRIVAVQEAAVTPEAQIRSYREAQIELASAKEKLEKLTELVTQAGSAGTMYGFVGGAQAIAVWGLIIIMVAGFVFLALYMKQIRGRSTKKKMKKEVVAAKTKKEKEVKKGHTSGRAKSKSVLVQYYVLLVAVGIASATVSAVITGKLMSRKIDQVREELALDREEEAVLGDEDSKEEEAQLRLDSDEADPLSSDDSGEAKGELGIGGQDVVLVEVPLQSKVNVRRGPSLTAEVITQFNSTREVVRIDEEGEWTEILFEDATPVDQLNELSEEVQAQRGWVYSEFVTEAEDLLGEGGDEMVSDIEDDVIGDEDFDLREIGGIENDLGKEKVDTVEPGSTVTILETPTGWLRVRLEPWGAEVGKVYPGQTFTLCRKSGDWLQIELGDGLGLSRTNAPATPQSNVAGTSDVPQARSTWEQESSVRGWVYSDYASVE